MDHPASLRWTDDDRAIFGAGQIEELRPWLVRRSTYDKPVFYLIGHPALAAHPGWPVALKD